MKHADEAPKPTEEIELWAREKVQEYFGGIHLSTLYRGVEHGIYPKPVYVSRNIVRWVASECRAALQRHLAERERERPMKPRRGRPRLHPVA